MQCERLKRLVRNWGEQIVEDALAPARMVEFVERHIRACDVCRADSTISPDAHRIRKMVVPFISVRDPQKAARFEEILEAQAGSEHEAQPEDEITIGEEPGEEGGADAEDVEEE